MPDIGGLGRGLLKGALSATEKAAEKVKDAAQAASRTMTDDDPDATQVIENAADPDATLVISDPDATQVIPGTAHQTPSRAPLPPPPGPVGPRPGDQGPSAPGTPRFGPQMPPAAHAASLSGTSAGGPPRATGGVPAGMTIAPSVPAPSSSGAPASGSPLPQSTHAPTGLTVTPFAALAPVGEPALADEPDERADASDVRELVEMFQRLLARRRPPAGPVQGEWAIGLGDLLAEHPKVPERMRGLVGKLNRFGGLSYSPREVVFDGEGVPWEKVTEVRTRHVVDYLVGDAVQQQVENLPMPWFPGRKRLLDALGQAVLTVTIATAKNQLEKFDLDMRVPAEIACKASFGRTKELSAGVLSALVLADPAVNQSLVATARARGITVTSGDDETLADADERAEKIREKVAALEAELERFTTRFGRPG